MQEFWEDYLMKFSSGENLAEILGESREKPTRESLKESQEFSQKESRKEYQKKNPEDISEKFPKNTQINPWRNAWDMPLKEFWRNI